MASPPDQIADDPADPRSRGWRIALGRAAVLLLVILLGLVIAGWTQREKIAGDLIGGELAKLNIEAAYNITEINTDRQILTDIVIGDPANPDLTIDRVEVELAYGLGIPEIGQITIFTPRLYGVYRDGKLSFGALDPAIYDESSDQPAGLPAIDLNMRDGRALIDSDFGTIGVKMEGRGGLDSGFEGIVAAIAPELSFGGCVLGEASLFGNMTTSGGVLSLDGPMRLAQMRCEGADLSASGVVWPAKLTLAEDFTSFTLDGPLASGPIISGPVGMPLAAANTLSGPVSIVYGSDQIDANLDLTFSGITAAGFAADSVTVDGAIRSGEAFSRHRMDADIAGEGLAIGDTVQNQLTDYAVSAEGTLLAPLLRKFSAALQRETIGSRFSATVIGQSGADEQTLLLPEMTLRNNSGAAIMSMSRVEYRQQGKAIPQLSGNFRSGGQGLPQIVGRMERRAGVSEFRLRMQPYSANDSVIAVPEMLVTQSGSGVMTFGGSILASGPLPGGMARNLRLPVSGTLDGLGALSLWRRCTDAAFDVLQFANLELNAHSVTLCPVRGSAIVTYDGGGLKIAAGAPSLDVAGNLAGTPVTIRSGPIGIAYPGIAIAQQLSVQLGSDEAASRVLVSHLQANLADGITGSFSGADMGVAAVPLDLVETAGDWSYADGVLRIDNAGFILLDRAEDARFNPLPVSGGSLTLKDNVIRANASVRAPVADREVSQISLLHSLETGIGNAKLSVPGLTFDDALQPTDLTPLALGVVANVQGVVTGSGRIDWNADETSSHGAFSSQSLDLAAAFGPVKGASGTVRFVDLLSMTTAPDQIIEVASVNPGIEAKDGRIAFSLRDGQFLGVTGGEWPFMGGTLTLRPVDLNLGAAEERRYVLEVAGLESSQFVENLELGNLAATGKFDGSLPLIFDETGFGRIEGGSLRSRSPGGNVSYVGELTYEDMSPIANYTFGMLKSLDYETMSIGMDGPLTGDIVTKLQFSGVKQGEGTKQNFITRQIADLPIQLNVNIRAPFYKLVTTLKSIYDPSTVRDPRDIGLLSDDGTRFVPATDEPIAMPRPDVPVLPPTDVPVLPPTGLGESPLPATGAILPDEPSIQTPDSEIVP